MSFANIEGTGNIAVTLSFMGSFPHISPLLCEQSIDAEGVRQVPDGTV